MVIPRVHPNTSSAGPLHFDAAEKLAVVRRRRVLKRNPCKFTLFLLKNTHTGTSEIFDAHLLG